MTRYELSHSGSGTYRIRFVDVESGTYQDYEFERIEFRGLLGCYHVHSARNNAGLDTA